MLGAPFLLLVSQLAHWDFEGDPPVGFVFFCLLLTRWVRLEGWVADPPVQMEGRGGSVPAVSKRSCSQRRWDLAFWRAGCCARADVGSGKFSREVIKNWASQREWPCLPFFLSWTVASSSEEHTGWGAESMKHWQESAEANAVFPRTRNPFLQQSVAIFRELKGSFTALAPFDSG